MRPGHCDDREIWAAVVAQQSGAQPAYAGAVEQQVVPPTLLYDLGDHDEDRAARMLGLDLGSE